MSDVEQISGKNEIKIATGPNKTSVKLHSLPIQHHHHPHPHPHHPHPHHQGHYLKPIPQQQHQHQHHQQHEQYREKNQHQQLSSTLTIEEGTGSNEQTEIGHHSPTGGLGCFSKVLKVFFSTPGLVVLVVVYSVMGALIFPLLEAPQDIMKNVAIAKSREDCLKELWIITEKLNVLYEQNWTMLVHEQLRRFEGSIVAATRNGGMVGVGAPATSTTTTTSAAAAVTTTGFELDKGRWSFSEALLYSVTVITTIGHGNLTPKSSAGKIATILYALIGVPLMLMCLSSLGGLLAEALQCTYTRICCRLQKVRQQHKQHQQKNRGTPADGLRRKSSDSMGSSSCHGQSHEMDCKSCKYDPVIEETSIQNSYKYTSSSEREDSCQLLHNSPTPNSSPCIQLKSQPMPPPNLKQYHQQHLAMVQQHQHQHQQQQQQLHHQMTPSPQHHQSYQMSPTRIPNNNTTATKYHQQVMVPNNVHAQHQHLVEQNGCTEITGTATIYFPIQTTAPPPPLSGSHHVSMPVAAAAAAAAVHYNHQPLVKYHTIQLQHKKAMAGGMATTTTTGSTTIAGPTVFEQQLPGHMTVGTGMTTLTLPPPPHYQTATVHGIRRAKFLAKPMPQEINTLLAESDISCRHDGSANLQQSNSRAGSDSGNSSSTPGSVDIMEDEEENEQSRMGCPHGTPSRVPLIPSSPGSGVGGGGGAGGGRKNYLGQDSSSKTILDTRKAASVNVASDNNGTGQRRRVRLMTTNNSKASRKNNCCLDSSCNLHTDPMTTEDEDYDDEDDNCKEDDDDADDDDDDADEDGIPQVPITIVLLILVAYICIGTVIFALWENWSLIDGAYFCFVTLSTIGYGDFMPEHTFRGPNVQLFACCAYLLLGLVLVAMSFSILETQLMWKCKRIAVRLKLARND